MRSLEALVEEYKDKFNVDSTSINDLIIKDMHDKPLSENQHKAIQNFSIERIKNLQSAVGKSKFSNITFITRLAANLVPYKEFV
jgi:hypothetical protein